MEPSPATSPILAASACAAAVTLLIFNRPDPTRRVFERIRAARPKRLFVVADGPRATHPDDGPRCSAARAITEAVDWPCLVQRDYARTNQGCGRRVASGLDWVFAQVPESIVLEDDCLPDPTFFTYCDELLERYRDEPSVGLVSGSHHQTAHLAGETSYYFCRYGNIWGWATWRRAWEKFDHSMSAWPSWRDAGGLERMFPEPAVRAYWRSVWNDAAAGRHDTWDYQWTFAYMRHGLLGVLPRVAMIENIGFGADASHTAGAANMADRARPMRFPLVHPTAIAPDLAAERRASARFFSRHPVWRRVLGKLARGTRGLAGKTKLEDQPSSH
jgi:hypothetical protein